MCFDTRADTEKENRKCVGYFTNLRNIYTQLNAPVWANLFISYFERDSQTCLFASNVNIATP